MAGLENGENPVTFASGIIETIIKTLRRKGLTVPYHREWQVLASRLDEGISYCRLATRLVPTKMRTLAF